MKEVQMIAMVFLCTAAVLTDLSFGKIPNGITAAGLAMGFSYQAADKAWLGIPLYLGGALLPVVLLGILYYFRMIGAGDIKLLCAIGGFLGPADCFSCLTAAVLFGGVMALTVMLAKGNVWKRWLYFTEYVGEYSRTGRWRSYLEGTEKDARFCFSVPVLLSVLWYVGKII